MSKKLPKIDHFSYKRQIISYLTYDTPSSPPCYILDHNKRMQRTSCCMENIILSTPAEAMNRDLTNLADALHQIAYDAGRALLFPVDADTTRRFAAEYNWVYRQLREHTPSLASAVLPLSEDASPGSIRIAARTAAAYAQDTTVSCCHKLAA